MSKSAGDTRTLAICDSCGDAFVAMRGVEDGLHPVGKERCDCGENRLRELS